MLAAKKQATKTRWVVVPEARWPTAELRYGEEVWERYVCGPHGVWRHQVGMQEWVVCRPGELPVKIVDLFRRVA